MHSVICVWSCGLTAELLFFNEERNVENQPESIFMHWSQSCLDICSQNGQNSRKDKQARLDYTNWAKQTTACGPQIPRVPQGPHVHCVLAGFWWFYYQNFVPWAPKQTISIDLSFFKRHIKKLKDSVHVIFFTLEASFTFYGSPSKWCPKILL